MCYEVRLSGAYKKWHLHSENLKWVKSYLLHEMYFWACFLWCLKQSEISILLELFVMWMLFHLKDLSHIAFWALPWCWISLPICCWSQALQCGREGPVNFSRCWACLYLVSRCLRVCLSWATKCWGEISSGCSWNFRNDVSLATLFLDNAKLHFTVCSTKYNWKTYLCLSIEKFPQSVCRL